MNKITICIPRVENHVNKKLIYEVFNDYDFGIIKKIDLLNIGKYKRIFIHYKYWNTKPTSIKVKNILMEKKDIKLIYNSPWYWECSLYIPN